MNQLISIQQLYDKYPQCDCKIKEEIYLKNQIIDDRWSLRVQDDNKRTMIEYIYYLVNYSCSINLSLLIKY